MTLFSSVDAFWVGTRIGAAGLAAVSTSLFWIWMIVSLAEMVGVGLTAVAARRYGERRRERSGAARRRRAGVQRRARRGRRASSARIGCHALFALMHTPPDVTALGSRVPRDVPARHAAHLRLLRRRRRVPRVGRHADAVRAAARVRRRHARARPGADPRARARSRDSASPARRSRRSARAARRSCSALAIAVAPRAHARSGAFELAAIWSVCRVGLPTAVTGMTFSLIYVFLTRTTTQFGTPALAALGIGHRVESWLFMIGVGFGAATAAIVGQNLGAGRADRAARAGWIATGFCTLLGVVAFVLELAIPAPVRVAVHATIRRSSPRP